MIQFGCSKRASKEFDGLNLVGPAYVDLSPGKQLAAFIIREHNA
jgi:hypothetical protein